MPPPPEVWGLIFAPACFAKLLGAKAVAPAPWPAPIPEYNTMWSDYPAFALLQQPSGPTTPTQVAYLDGTVYNNPKKYHQNLGGIHGYKPKKDRIPGPPVATAVNNPVFDIVVEPQYQPDPFPVPYPYPIEMPPPDDLYVDVGRELAPMAPSHDDEDENADYMTSEPKRRKPKYKRTSYIERAEPQWTCPKDYMEESKKCVKFDVVDVEVGCVDGWDYRSGECYAIDIQIPELVCPAGFEKNGMTCEKKIIAPKQMMCGENQYQTVHGCKEKKVADPLPQCIGSVMQDGLCVRTKRLRPDPRCPEGFGLSADHRVCLRDSVSGGHQACGAGFALNDGANVCERVVLNDPITSCPYGYTRDGTTCLRRISRPMIRSCDFGVLTAEGACLSTRTLGKPNLVCPPNAVLNAHLRCEITLRTSTHKSKKAKKDPCEPNYKLIGDECVRTMLVDPSYVCDATGSELVGQECVMSMSTPATAVCPPGQTLEGDACFMNEATATETRCSQGFSLTLDGKCARQETDEVQLACPLNFKPGTDNLCHQIERIDATLICPASTELKVDIEFGSDDYVCYGVESVDPILSCPIAGLELESTDGGMKCTGWQVTEPAFVCAAGFTDEGGKCLKLETTAKHPVCPADYAYSFDTCLKEMRQPALFFCPDGYAHQKNSRTCNSKTFTEPIAVCPGDMEFDSLVNECYRMNSEIAFDEAEKVTPKSDGGGTKSPQEALKDLEVPTTSTTTTVGPLGASGPGGLTPAAAALGPAGAFGAGGFPPFPMSRGYDEQPVAPAIIPPPQLTIVQQPVVVPQPAVILPQQAPVPPAPTIRVPYAVPQPVPTPVRPLEHHVHHVQTNSYVQPMPAAQHHKH